MDKRTIENSVTQTSMMSCAKIIFVLTTNCPVNPNASPAQQLRSLPFDAPLKGRIKMLAVFGKFKPNEKELLVMQC